MKDLTEKLFSNVVDKIKEKDNPVHFHFYHKYAGENMHNSNRVNWSALSVVLDRNMLYIWNVSPCSDVYSKRSIPAVCGRNPQQSTGYEAHQRGPENLLLDH